MKFLWPSQNIWTLHFRLCICLFGVICFGQIQSLWMGQSLPLYRRTGRVRKSIQFSKQFLVYNWITYATRFRCGTHLFINQTISRKVHKYHKLKYFTVNPVLDPEGLIMLIQWNLDLRKILGVTKIFLKSRFFLISNARKPLKKHNFAKWTSETIQMSYCSNIVKCFWLYL